MNKIKLLMGGLILTGAFVAGFMWANGDWRYIVILVTACVGCGVIWEGLE